LTEAFNPLPSALQVVLADANVLYSRVLRDYLLYAGEEEVITVVWSQKILDEMREHLVANVPRFDQAAARRLIDAMTATFTESVFDPTPDAYARLDGIALPDEDDRHVIAAALSADADIICTSNTKDFPRPILARFGISVMSPDDLFTQLIGSHMMQMINAHRNVVSNHPGATDQSTIDTLRRAQAPRTADLLTALLNL